MSANELSNDVVEQLWRVVDAARIAIRLPDNVTQDEALSFLADQEKMLRRAVGCFEGSEENARKGASKHPWVVELEEQRREYIRGLRAIVHIGREIGPDLASDFVRGEEEDVDQ